LAETYPKGLKMLTETEEQIIRFARDPAKGLRIVVIGGGTGLSTMLRGLKLYSNHLTAIVTVADNGGSSGMLREELGMLPPGDIRNCILALADTEPLMSDLLNYRFTEGRLQGQNFGNLLIAAMNAISGNFYDAVRNVSKVLAVTGRVLPVSLQDIQIIATLADQTVIRGENAIGNRPPTPGNEIEQIRMEPADAAPLAEAVEALKQAEVIVLGPGSLYTSIIPNLLFPSIREAILRSSAAKIYVCNIMTQPAETLDYDATRHVQAILKHAQLTCAQDLIAHCVINSAQIPSDLAEKYRKEFAVPVAVDQESMRKMGISMTFAPLITTHNDVIRHDHTMLARMIMQLVIEHQTDSRQAIKTARKPSVKRQNP
jgi:uncharacterized cofD-like protein